MAIKHLRHLWSSIQVQQMLVAEVGGVTLPALLQILLVLHTTIKQVVQVVWIVLDQEETATAGEDRLKQAVLTPDHPSNAPVMLLMEMETNDLVNTWHLEVPSLLAMLSVRAGDAEEVARCRRG